MAGLKSSLISAASIAVWLTRAGDFFKKTKNKDENKWKQNYNMCILRGYAEQVYATTKKEDPTANSIISG